MHSHHSHSGAFCAHADASTSPRSMLHRASSLGFTTYHLSEHVPRLSPSHLYPEEVDAGLTPSTLRETFERYLTEARKVQREVREGRFGSVRDTLVGAETENIFGGEDGTDSTASTIDYLVEVLNGRQGVEDGNPAAIGRGRVDYLVGSIHHARGIPIDFSPELFTSACQACCGGASQPEAPSSSSSALNDVTLLSFLRMTSIYLDAQLSVLSRLRPEVIGHFDLNRLFSPSHPLLISELSPSSLASLSPDERAALEESDAKVRRNVAFAASYGALFEINSAAFRKGWNTAYPGEEVLKLILSLGGRVCLSDDAHSHAQVGLNYVRARDYLMRLGVERVWYLEPSGAEEGSVVRMPYEEEERHRQAREGSDRPGEDAPTSFARGCKAVASDEGWDQGAFWDELEARRERAEAEAKAQDA